MNRTTFKLLENYMHTCMQDSAHDREHVYRVLNNALRIAQGEDGINRDVLIAATLLHDISRAEQMADSRIDHAAHGAEKAYAFLLNHDFPADFCEHVRRCIRTHRFRKAEPPASREAEILFDADKLDVAGAVGIARTLLYSGETGRPLYNRDASGLVSDGTADTEDSFFREYKFKLAGICDHFLTEKGRALARERHAAAIAYYEALLREVQDDVGLSALEDLLTDA